ncbi:hypothetical protein ACJJTC_007230 [Scirpophaga incertulas]
MSRHIFVCLMALNALSSVLPETTPAPATAAPSGTTEDEAPEGYYAFVESPNATPPRVRGPPYRRVAVDCAGASGAPHVTAANLCGDLNRGDVPNNPMGHDIGGEPYPFELIRNHTLRFLSRALPALRHDDSLPRVTRLQATDPLPDDVQLYHNGLDERSKRSADGETPRDRDGRKFCDGGGVFCMLYRAINGDGEPALERREDPGHRPPGHKYEGPPTPCPARVEYATPVFARNYQGVWRYIVQIPYEGYFTQTVEVTRCLQARCHYLDGGCLSSPRWLSLLAAELHYPQEQQYSQKSGTEETTTDKPLHCDGHDKFGCFQVRLYYDWFLVPGSCKCWRPDYFARYVRRRHSADL